MNQVVWSIQLHLLKIGPYIHITGMEHAVFKRGFLSTVIYIWVFASEKIIIVGSCAEKSSDFCYVVESTLKQY